MTRVGNYVVGKKIGEGGFGIVFEGEHTHVKGKKVCLKQNRVAAPEDVELLKHEFSLLWELDEYHSIPAVKDFFVLDTDTAVMVMKHINGKTLEEVVSSKGPLHPEDASWIVERLLGALHYSHHYGVIHGDVKPQNVFVEPEKHDIKLIDFGLATYKPKSTTKATGYTPRYAAPELTRGGVPIPESDLYGVGIVLLRALGGDVMKKSYRTDTPKLLEDFCSSLLAYDPAARPNWEKNNPITTLSNIRLGLFGRRHRSDHAGGAA